jgi:Toxin SymE, type I toxin-antitoxin system
MPEKNTEQRFTVASFYPPGWHGHAPYSAVPFLPLAGPWLWEAGFSIGAEVHVFVERGRLVVELRGEEA